MRPLYPPVRLGIRLTLLLDRFLLLLGHFLLRFRLPFRRFFIDFLLFFRQLCRLPRILLHTHLLLPPSGQPRKSETRQQRQCHDPFHLLILSSTHYPDQTLVCPHSVPAGSYMLPRRLATSCSEPSASDATFLSLRRGPAPWIPCPHDPGVLPRPSSRFTSALNSGLF